MSVSPKLRICLAGLAAGAANAVFGAGGGMVLVPMLTRTELSPQAVFPASVCIIAPVCIVTLLLSPHSDFPAFSELLPYLLGSVIGGIACGKWGKHIPVLWLHRILGLMILWGGVRYLC